MSLRDATAPLAHLPPWPEEGPPYPCAALAALAGLEFHLVPGDFRLGGIDRGGPAPTPPLENLVGAREAWLDHPAWMDFLAPDSPNFHKKRVEKELYLHWWAPHLRPGARVLDAGGGIGRFTQHCLDLGCEVELVDPDLRSLRCAVEHAAGRPGRLDVHWTTAERMPALRPVEVVIAAELLNYVEDPARVMDNLRRALAPGGVLLLSVEARWGWAMAPDAAGGTLPALWSADGVVHAPHDRWVRIYDRAGLDRLLDGWTVEAVVPTHYVVSGPFEYAAGSLDTADVLAAEARLRAHPVLGPLNRAWTVIARP